MIQIVRRIAIRQREGGVGSGHWHHLGIPGHKGGSAPGDGLSRHVLAQKILNQFSHSRIGAGDAGITIDLKGDIPNHGFVIGGGGEEYIKDPPISEAEVESYITRNLGELSKSSHYFGAWVDDGKIYFDVSTVRAGQSKSDALAEARMRDQIAIWSLDEGKGYYTMNDHLRPSESHGDPLNESARQGAGPTLVLFGKDVSKKSIAATLNAEARRQIEARGGRVSITIRKPNERG